MFTSLIWRARRATNSINEASSNGGSLFGRRNNQGNAPRGGAGALQRLLVLLARLAGMDARVDQAGREIEAAAVDRFDAVGRTGSEQVGAVVGDLAVADHDRTLGLGI